MNIAYQLADIKRIAKRLWDEASDCKIWTFYGAMGVGKTTFIHGLCKTLKVEDAIGSPTYAIINEYKSPVAGTIYHMDLFRLKNEEEALQAGVEDCFRSGNLCLIEWPEIAAGILPDNVFHIFIEVLHENTRNLYAQIK